MKKKRPLCSHGYRRRVTEQTNAVGVDVVKDTVMNRHSRLII